MRISRVTRPRNCDRPLVVRCGAFGDMVLITSLIQDLATKFQRDVDLLTSGPWSEPLLRGQPGVGEIICVRSRKTPYWFSQDQRRAVRLLRARGVGPTWFCDGNDAARPMLRRAGITEEYIVDAKDHPLLPGEHATQQWRRLAQIAPAAMAFTGPSSAAAESRAVSAAGLGGSSLEVGAAQLRDLKGWLSSRRLLEVPLIAIQAGNKRTMRRGLRRLATNSKYWPIERWAKVLQYLRHCYPAHAIVLLGTGPEFRLNEDIITAAATDGIYNLADDLPIRRLVALLGRVAGLITVDSGPAHAAAAVGCPEVVLFGRAATSLYRPWGTRGSDVIVLTGEVDGKPNILGIEPSSVIAAWGELHLRTR